MCSIFAVLDINGDVQALRQLALRQSRLMRHRGPDWSGVHAAGNAVLAHERLHALLQCADARIGLALGGQPRTITPRALEALVHYDWPGNVRQLVNATRRLTVTAPGTVITTEDIPTELGGSETSQRAAQDWTRSLASWAERQLSAKRGPLLDTALPEFEKTLIQIAMSQTGGHRQEAAKLLGWGRNTLTRKMKSLQLD